jgi:hypothetical protein
MHRFGHNVCFGCLNLLKPGWFDLGYRIPEHCSVVSFLEYLTLAYVTHSVNRERVQSNFITCKNCMLLLSYLYSSVEDPGCRNEHIAVFWPIHFNNIVPCLGSFCTATCRVSGYPRQVIKVATLLRQLRFIWTALPTVITLNNYTTRHL